KTSFVQERRLLTPLPRLQCDESRPVCNKCVQFRAACGYHKPGESAVTMDYSAIDSPVLPGNPNSPPRRKPGRPRKIWAPKQVEIISSADAVTRWLQQQQNRPLADFGCCTETSGDPVTDDVELLVYWVGQTARSVADFFEPGAADLTDFWTHDALRAGFSSPYILHLILALSARHMLRLELGDSCKRRRLLSLAERHTAKGVVGMTVALSTLNEYNCGALYVASILACLCVFAEGPVGPHDLLVTGARPGSRFPMLCAMSMICQAVQPEILFSGIFAVLDRGSRDDVWRADLMCSRRKELGHSPRIIAWERPMALLGELVASQTDNETKCHSRAFRQLKILYETHYGREDAFGLCCPTELDPGFGSIMRWLDVMDRTFIESLEKKNDVSLLLLTYFVPLLQNLRGTWLLGGWAEQLLLGARAQLSPGYVSWLQWPLEATGLLLTESEADDVDLGIDEGVESSVEGARLWDDDMLEDCLGLGVMDIDDMLACSPP
ncbi:hypothetical protein F5X68DRAFT_250739, partial [Plectosphaerella plurivora]